MAKKTREEKKLEKKAKLSLEEEMNYIQELMNYCVEIDDKENYWKLHTIRVKLQERKIRRDWGL